MALPDRRKTEWASTHPLLYSPYLPTHYYCVHVILSIYFVSKTHTWNKAVYGTENQVPHAPVWVQDSPTLCPPPPHTPVSTDLWVAMLCCCVLHDLMHRLALLASFETWCLGLPRLAFFVTWCPACLALRLVTWCLDSACFASIVTWCIGLPRLASFKIC